MFAAILSLGLLAAAVGALLVFSRSRFEPDEDTAVEQINQLLPQTQCAQCGYPGCRPYAKALIEGTADIDQCPPGGESTQRALQQALGKPAGQLSPVSPWLEARIDEEICIGCALCIPACPVDAIIGANKFTHTVVADECTGCELCVAVCPVDCISIGPGLPRQVAPLAVQQAETG